MQIFNGINVVSISVPDLDRQKTSTEKLWDLEARLRLARRRMDRVLGRKRCRQHIHRPAEPGWRPSFTTTVVLNVADCHAAVAELRRRGVQCDEPTVFPGFVIFASFFDPFGNRLQMCSPSFGGLARERSGAFADSL